MAGILNYALVHVQDMAAPFPFSNHVFANKLSGVNNTVTTHFTLGSLPGCRELG